MYADVLRLLRCANCGRNNLSHSVFKGEEDGKIIDGVVWCTCCFIWYPIEEELLEFLVGKLAYSEDRERFWLKYEGQLRDWGLCKDEKKESTMEESEQLKQQSHFDWYSGAEEQSYWEYEHTPFWLAADKIAFSPWRREIQSGKWLLDVGCAQGRSSFKVMDLNLKIVGFDVSKRLIRQAIGRYRANGYSSRATFFVADATRFPFVSESFDYVLIYGVLHHVPDPASVCTEVARVLRRTGTYLGQENNKSAFRAAFDLLQKLNPQWHEEAGPEALIGADDLERWFGGTEVRPKSHTSIFLPPHLVNLVGEKVGYHLLNLTDRFASVIPFLRQNGGVILVRGEKESSPDPSSTKMYSNSSSLAAANADSRSLSTGKVTALKYTGTTTETNAIRLNSSD